MIVKQSPKGKGDNGLLRNKRGSRAENLKIDLSDSEEILVGLCYEYACLVKAFLGTSGLTSLHSLLISKRLIASNLVVL